MDEEIQKRFEAIEKEVKELKEKMGIGENKIITKEENIVTDNNLETEISIFCKNNQIEGVRLKYKIDFQKDFPRLINLPRESVRTSLQFSVLILLSPLIYRVYKKSFSRDLIKELFVLNRIPTERMDKLYESPKFIQLFSKSGADIKLSWAGEQEGIKRLKELIENETNTSK